MNGHWGLPRLRPAALVVCRRNWLVWRKLIWAGLLMNFPDESSLIPVINFDSIQEARDAYADGRMKIKLLAAEEAIKAGVKRVVLGNSRRDHPVRDALSGKGKGAKK